MRGIRGDFQIIFQDPYASLNPRLTVADIIAEPMDTMKAYKNQSERFKHILKLMDECGLSKTYFNRYPHEFSGGQRQRIGIARAISVNPKLIVCDEPVSALDVSIQSQIINLLLDLQEEYNLTLVFISHDLGVVEFIADRVAVMYLGKIIELSGSQELFRNAMHPYTKMLFESIPKIGKTRLDKTSSTPIGHLPSPIDPPPGCSFHTRCRYAKDDCGTTTPVLREISPGHSAACLYLE
jgi:oligopeptide transport system ATP-binding protein